jgi:hypothetical protein
MKSMNQDWFVVALAASAAGFGDLARQVRVFSLLTT